MKRLILFAAVALALSTGAIAQNGAGKSTAAKLSDAELDHVTAGGMLLFNPGKRVTKFENWSCMNCPEWQVLENVYGTGGLKVEINANGLPVINKYIGKWRAAMPQ